MEPHPRIRNGHPDVQCVQRPNISFACTECFGPHNIEECIMVKKAVKRYCSNNLKNDYESGDIKSQDSEHEDKKSDNQYSECDDEEETYAYYNKTLWNKMCPHARLFINHVLCQECNNYLQVCQKRNNHALCQECNNYQQLKLSAKNARSTNNSSASASNTSISSIWGVYWLQHQHRS